MVSQKASSSPCVAVYFSVSPKSHKELTFPVPPLLAETFLCCEQRDANNKGAKELLGKTPPSCYQW